MWECLKRFVCEIKGATMLEYALIVSVVAFIVVVAAFLFGSNLLGIYETFKI